MTKSEENSIADGLPTGTTSEAALHQGQIMAAYASVASSSTTGLDDTMHGVPEITSSMASSKTPTGATSTPATATPASSRSKSGPDTTPFKKDSYDPYRNNNNNGDGKSLRKGVPEDVMSTAGSSSTTDFQESGSSVQQSNGHGDGFKRTALQLWRNSRKRIRRRRMMKKRKKSQKGSAATTF
ncbi:Oidioi.mRNA.OKI2018_I69.XSR.g16568.t1.cds [Oikopleura dioica]|uniref:Oidioi.mRNA.OKI2018_I69.XSR.g16568.t1.cds n=1 Tax=Oikopleura dioica TaxID=34765 RepID=A0ABN7SLM5_OIKDI|nr:Oidioi.mRNA.OKI2018_I69.XSR.g16568.t1.cds [Oikopleura dioica]